MEHKLLPDDNTFKKWAEFCSTYRGDFWKTLEFEADFIPKKEEDQNEDDYLKSAIALMFKNLDKKMILSPCKDKLCINFSCFALLTSSTVS